MWQWALAAIQKFKQNAQTHDARGMQAMSVLYITVRGCCISTILRFMGGGCRGSGRSTLYPFSDEAPATRHATH